AASRVPCWASGATAREQRHRLLIKHRLDRLARCLDIEAVLLDQVVAIDQDGVGVLEDLQPLGMIVMTQPYPGADDFQKAGLAEQPQQDTKFLARVRRRATLIDGRT